MHVNLKWDEWSWHILLFSCNSYSYDWCLIMETCSVKSLMMFRWTMLEWYEWWIDDELDNMWIMNRWYVECDIMYDHDKHALMNDYLCSSIFDKITSSIKLIWVFSNGQIIEYNYVKRSTWVNRSIGEILWSKESTWYHIIVRHVHW